MPRKIGALTTGEVSILRQLTVTPIVAENASLIDANYPVAEAIDCSGYDTVLIGVEITAGTNPTMTIEALFRDEDAPDGARWKRLLLGAPPGVTLAAAANETTPALVTGANFYELRVFGHKKVFFRVSAVGSATSTTAWKILGIPGKTRPDWRSFSN